MSAQRIIRLGLGALGVVVMAIAVLGIVHDRAQTAPVYLAIWLVAGVALHDGVVAPLLIVLGALVLRLVPVGSRAVASVGLVAAGTVLLVGVPVIIASHRPKQNATILPRNYTAALLLTEAVVLGLTALVILGLTLARRRRVTAA